MKIKKTYFEVVKFENEDVIATSGVGIHSFSLLNGEEAVKDSRNTVTLESFVCPNGDTHPHLFYDQQTDTRYAIFIGPAGQSYATYSNNLYEYQAVDNKWMHWVDDGDGYYVVCGNGQ